MKIQTITGANSHQAMLRVHQLLGPEALIYSTRKKGNEVEILAGLPGSTDTDGAGDLLNAEALNKQIKSIQDSLKQIAKKMHLGYPEEQLRSQLYYYLGHLGLHGKFRHRFVDQYLLENDQSSVLNKSDIDEKISESLKVDEHELIEVKNICALVGPTGVGKSTTIVKLAKRYINKYDSASIGIITTDASEVVTKNLLMTYTNVFGVDLLHAHTPTELTQALEKFNEKSFVLIDTSGISQRNTQKIEELAALEASYEGLISYYLTLPCNIQEGIMEDIAHAFSALNLSGCILTKTDESHNLSAAVNLCLNHDLNISYLCNGQNIYTDIYPAEVEEIMSSIKVSHLLNDGPSSDLPFSGHDVEKSE